MLTIIDFKMGNLHSVYKAFDRIGCEAVISDDPATINMATKIIIPGVGHFKRGMENLKSQGLVDILDQKVLVEKVPVLGICLGMQLMTQFSEEGDVAGLGWVNARVRKFDSSKLSGLKVPHMGWNEIKVLKNSSILSYSIIQNSYYFVHSYFVDPLNNNDILAETNYGIDFCSAFEHENIIGVQFHPEKSHKTGLDILKNFAAL